MVSRGKVGNSQHFPTNLHILLDEAEKANHSHIVSWCAQGNSFRIHDQEAIVPLLAKYFRQTKFKSFLRQLQSYGFHRTTRGCDKGIVSHPLFVRGRRSLCFRMSRKPSGAAAAASHSVIPRGTSSSANVVYQLAAIPSNGIIPIRKVYSAPINSLESSMQRNGTFTKLSELKNETFKYQGHTGRDLDQSHRQLLKNYLVEKVASGALPRAPLPPPKRRSSESILPPLNHRDKPFVSPLRRRSSASATMTTEQRDSILKCAEIDYRVESSSGDIQIPRETFLLSIKESSTAPQETPSHQQVVFQVQPFQQQKEHLPQRLPQDQSQAQQTYEPQSQVRMQQLYREEQEPQHQVRVKHHSQEQTQRYPENPRQEQYQFAPQQEIQYTRGTKHAGERLYSHQEVIEQIEKARQDIAKQYRKRFSPPRPRSRSDPNFGCDKFQDLQSCQQEEEQQLESHDMQSQQQLAHQQEFEQPDHHQPGLLHPAADVHRSKKSHPSSGGFDFSAPPVCADPPCLKRETSDVFAAPFHNNFNLSFSTAEFKGGTVVKHEDETASGACFSEATPIPTPDAFASGGSTAPCNTTNTYRTMHRPPTIESKNLRTSTAVTNDFFERHTQPQHEQNVGGSAGPEPVKHCDSHQQYSSNENRTEDNIDTGTVDFLLQNGSGGCDEWEMQTEDMGGGQNYYGFLNSADPVDFALADSCPSDPHLHLPDRNHNQIPVSCTASLSPSNM